MCGIQNNKTNNIKITYLNGYDAIREALHDSNTSTAKKPVAVNEKSNSRVMGCAGVVARAPEHDFL